MLDKLIFLVAIAGTAVVFADVLVREGMLLAPVQRWVRSVYQKATTIERDIYGVAYKSLDEQWWWKPLWGCSTCVSGQWGFWGYLIRYHAHYNFFEHIAFAAFTIIAAIILRKWTE